MRLSSAAAYLRDFSRPHVVPEPLSPDGVATTAGSVSVPDSQCEFEEGLRQGHALAAQEWSEKLASAEARREADLVESERRFRELGSDVALRLEANLSALGHALADRVAEILRPFVLERVADQSAKALLGALHRLERHAGNLTVEIEGPAALGDAIASHLQGRAISVVRRESLNADVRLRIDGSALELGLSEWAQELDKLGAERNG